MSLGVICFTSFGSSDGCWLVFVFFLGNIFFSLKKKGFFSPTRLTPKKSVRNLRQKKNFGWKKNVLYIFFHN